MNGLFSLSWDKDTRFILSGDYRQHHSIESGDALRLIEERSGIKPVRVDEIMRQRTNEEYKQAIELLSKGETLRGFERLENMGAIKEIEDDDLRKKEIAAQYVNSINENRSALLITPTHLEGKEITETIRENLKTKGKLGQQDRQLEVLRDLGFTTAEKSLPASFSQGMIVQFHGNEKGFKLGDHYEIKSSDSNQVLVGRSGTDQMIPLPLDRNDKFQIYSKESIAAAENDIIRINKNITSANDRKLHNGQIARIESFDEQGRIKLDNGALLDKHHKNISLGYYSTSFASQGKTSQDVIIAQSALSHPASSQSQFYVSASRGSEKISIYCDNIQELKKAISQESTRMSATELETQRREKQLQDRMQEKLILSYYQNTNKKNNPENGRDIQRGNYGQPSIQMDQPHRDDYAG